MGAFVGLGTAATNISEAERESLQERLAKSRLALAQRTAEDRSAQLGLAAQRDFNMNQYRWATLQARLNDNPKLRHAEESAAVMLGYGSWDQVPEELRDSADTLVGMMMTNKQLLSKVLTSNDDSSTGVQQSNVNPLTGKTISTVQDVVVPGLAARPQPKPALTAEQALEEAKTIAKERTQSWGQRFSVADRTLIAEQARQNGIKLPDPVTGTWAHQEGMQKERQTFAETKGNSTQQEALGAVAVMKASFLGGPDENGDMQPGLISTLGVLDSTASRLKLAALSNEMGISSSKSFWSQVTPQMVSDLEAMVTSGLLNDDEFAYFSQMQRAATAIGGLRNITGKMRPTEALIQRMVRELPDPRTTNSSGRGLQKINLVMREVQAYINQVNAGRGPLLSSETVEQQQKMVTKESDIPEAQ